MSCNTNSHILSQRHCKKIIFLHLIIKKMLFLDLIKNKIIDFFLTK